MHERDIWREDSQNRHATAVFANACNWKTFRRGKYLPVIFLARYFIDAALLVIIHIQKTQKWASGYNPPLRSVELTMMCRIICRKSYTRRENFKVRINYCK